MRKYYNGPPSGGAPGHGRERAAKSRRGAVVVAGGDGPRADGFDDARLYSASVAVVLCKGSMLIFAAWVAPTMSEFRQRLQTRIGYRATQFARVRRGFDERDPVFDVLVAPASYELLERATVSPGSSMAAGFELWLEQRIGA